MVRISTASPCAWQSIAHATRVTAVTWKSVQWLINKFSRHMGESMVTVTTATPLSDEQVDKLVRIYSKKTGHPVHIHSVVDPTVMGGMRVHTAMRSPTTRLSHSWRTSSAR